MGPLNARSNDGNANLADVATPQTAAASSACAALLDVNTSAGGTAAVAAKSSDRAGQGAMFSQSFALLRRSQVSRPPWPEPSPAPARAAPPPPPTAAAVTAAAARATPAEPAAKAVAKAAAKAAAAAARIAAAEAKATAKAAAKEADARRLVLTGGSHSPHCPPCRPLLHPATSSHLRHSRPRSALSFRPISGRAHADVPPVGREAPTQRNTNIQAQPAGQGRLQGLRGVP